nr:hypothetical protein [Tanacetum cinerariifolium]
MRIEQYFLMTDYSLWEVILNGDFPVPTRVVEGVLQPVAPTTAEQKLARKNELKAHGTTIQNLAFGSSSNTDSTTESVSVVASVSAKMPVSSLPNVDSLSNRSFQAEEEPANYALMDFSSSSSSSDNEVFTRAMFDCDNYLSSESDESWPPSSFYDRFQPSDGYHVVSPPYIGTFMPPKPNLVFNTAHVAVETDHSAFTVQLSPTTPEQDLSHSNRPTIPIIEDWVSDSDDDSETHALQIAPSFVQSTEQVKSPRHSVQHAETSFPAATPKSASPKPASSGKRRNRKACFVCKRVDHLIKDCDYHAKKKAQPTPRNHAHMGNHKQYASLTHTNPQKHIVFASVLTHSKLVSITAVRPVCVVVPKIKVTR